MEPPTDRNVTSSASLYYTICKNKNKHVSGPNPGKTWGIAIFFRLGQSHILK